MKFTTLLLFVILTVSTLAQVNELSVMSYNVLVSTSIADNVNVIQQSNADIIGLQEGYGKSESIANDLGFYHYSDPAWSEAILSRYPIVETKWWGVKIELSPISSPDQYVYMFNVHLSAYPYQPYDIRDGDITTPAQAIDEAELARGSEMSSVLSEMWMLLQNDEEVFLTGDFNEPSHLDWTVNAANYGLHFGWEVQWPTSLMCADAGLQDAYRTYFPDEVLFSGETWTPWVSPNEVYDRIDMIYFSGDDFVLNGIDIVGPDTASTFIITPYESDHRAVLATFNLQTTEQIEVNKESITIYPNPVSEIGSITINSNLISEIRIFSSSGKLMLKDSGVSDKYTFQVQNFLPGIYIVEVSNLNFVYRQKLIVI